MGGGGVWDITRNECSKLTIRDDLARLSPADFESLRQNLKKKLYIGATLKDQYADTSFIDFIEKRTDRETAMNDICAAMRGNRADNIVSLINSVLREKHFSDIAAKP